MTNPQSLRFASKSAKLLALFFALILSLSLTTTAFAAPLTNGGFGTSPNCNLTGWTASTNDSYASSISAGTLTGYGGLSPTDCVGKIVVEAYGPAYFVASLSQTFTVPTGAGINDQLLNINVWAYSDNGVLPGGYSGYTGTQRIAIFRANGSNIVTVSHNYSTTQRGKFYYDLKPYAGQNVTLRMSVVLDFVNGYGSPAQGALYFDDVRFGPSPYGFDAYYPW
jgi:hypothetical protein